MKQTLSIGVWNINGWTDSNKTLRSEILKNLKLDIVCLCETHLKQKQVIVVENYIFYGHNREKTHIKAKKTYGGVGVLVSLRLYGNYDIKIVDKSVY